MQMHHPRETPARLPVARAMPSCQPSAQVLSCIVSLLFMALGPFGIQHCWRQPAPHPRTDEPERPPTGGPPRPDCALDSDTGLAATTTDQANTVLCRQAVGLPDSAASTHWGQHHDARSSSQCGPPFLALPGRQPRRCLRASVERHASYTTRASRKLAAHPSVVHVT